MGLLNSKRFFATCKLGLERVVADELKSLGADDLHVEDARVFFRGGWSVLCDANMWLRSADRVFVEIGSFEATSFGQLFDGVNQLFPWEDLFERNARLHVKGKTAKSPLHSVSDCQSITKKAIVERMTRLTGGSWLPETGNTYIIEVGMLGNQATIALDASGSGLGRRGYRVKNAQAPLSETLAASLVQLIRWNINGIFWDPMCGSGTIAIEAAMIAQNRAPGLKRTFAAEEWGFIDPKYWKAMREKANDLFNKNCPAIIKASDIDEDAVSLTQFHANRAGVKVQAFVQDVRNLQSDERQGTVICNPPYGMRLLDRKQAQSLYADMRGTFTRLDDWKFGVFTSDPQFHRFFGKRADKIRKLYNSNLVCYYYQYFKKH